MTNRGQMALFLVLAVFLLLLFSLTNFHQAIPPSVLTTTSPSEGDMGIFLDSIVQSCLDKTVEQAIYRLTAWGGHTIISRGILDILPVDVTRNHPQNGASITTMEKELSNRISQELPPCISQASQKSWPISLGKATTAVHITPDQILTEVFMPATLHTINNKNKNNNNLVVTRQSFSSRSRLPLYSLIETYSGIISGLASHPHETCISCIDQLLIRNHQTLETIDTDKDHTLFFLHQEGQSDNNPHLEFIFAVARGGLP